MDVKHKFNLITNHLLLEKEKKHLELERFINDSNVSIDLICDNISDKLKDYRDSSSNLETWMELIEPINNKPEKEEEG